MTAGATEPEVVVIGAGFAGVASALMLARRGTQGVRVLEAELGPGHHASGRNAAMARRVVEDPILARLATESVRELRALEARSKRALFRPVGGMLIGDEAACDALLEAAGQVDGLGDEVEALEGAELAKRVPSLSNATSRSAIYSPGCGVVDIHGLLSALIEEARSLGVNFTYGARVTGFEHIGGRIAEVKTSVGSLPCTTVVNAAGHAAGAVGAMAGASPAPLRPSRRHLYITEPTRDVPSQSPYVWDVTQGFYFRPEGDGLLLCVCDETPWGEEQVVIDPEHRDALAQVFLSHAPALGGVRPARSWAGLRTGTPDGRFVLGPDPQVPELVWAAGLGGHGMTTALGVGQLVASSVLGDTLPESYGAAFDPARW
jgi:D-arginine dehydrogenase